MKLVMNQGAIKEDIISISNVRGSLCAMFMSDIVTVDGKLLEEFALLGWTKLKAKKALSELFKSQFLELATPHDITQCAKSVRTAWCRNQRITSPGTHIKNSDMAPAQVAPIPIVHIIYAKFY